MQKLIRKANTSDAPNLIELNKLSNNANHVADNVETVQNSLSDNSVETVFVAEIEGEIIGFVTAQVATSFCYVRPTVELTEIYVKEQFRRKGVGSMMVEKIKQHSRDLDALQLLLRVNRSNCEAISFYESNGFESANHFEYRIKYYDEQDK